MAKNKMAVEKWKLVQKENGLLGQNVRFKGAKKFLKKKKKKQKKERKKKVAQGLFFILAVIFGATFD